MPRPRPLPVELGDAFSVADALGAGVSKRRLRALDLATPFHGVRRVPSKDESTAETEAGREARSSTEAEQSTGEAPLALDRRRRAATLRDARAYSQIMRPGAFFCGRTAACLFGAPVAPGGELDVAVCAPQRAPRARGIHGRKVSQRLAAVTELEELPISTPASTWTMLGRDLSERELVVAGDFFVQIPRDRFGRQHPELALATLDDLRAMTDAGARPPTTKLLRAALEQIRVGSSSPLETEFRLDAAAVGLPDPLLDAEIRDEHGRLLGISEIVYPEFRTVVEIEGDHHRTSRAQWHRDIEKYRAYVDAGWHVERLTSVHVRNSRHGLSIVAAALAKRGWSGFTR
ncbi:hypothetical protein [Microbacterium sp. SA39]|uniref:hypothetical protein n=1 Tax=Microbacterium sp. SA39 TaxID=1263625 RepID=UPI0005FA16BF|nr:hypothetical protein [Microbacterium sp. SA39]KJQ55106.1 hypothetical protein RS85_01165 [Microbacterium sp. SA39]